LLCPIIIDQIQIRRTKKHETFIKQEIAGEDFTEVARGVVWIRLI
jgi:hypothetical protein